MVAILEKLLSRIKDGSIKALQVSYATEVMAIKDHTKSYDVGYFPSRYKTVTITYEDLNENNIGS